MPEISWWTESRTGLLPRQADETLRLVYALRYTADSVRELKRRYGYRTDRWHATVPEGKLFGAVRDYEDSCASRQPSAAGPAASLAAGQDRSKEHRPNRDPNFARRTGFCGIFRVAILSSWGRTLLHGEVTRDVALQEVGIMTEDVRPTGTYRTLDEQREVLTPAEERFEKARQTIGLILGPIVFLIMYFAPLPLERNQHTLAAILSFVIVYWLSEAIPIPVTAMLGLALAVFFNVPAIGPNADDAPGDIVFGAFADPVIFLFIGAFVIAQAMITHGLDRRFAFRILSIPGVSSSTYGVIIAFGAIAATISSVISNTTTCAMLLPIGLGMIGALGGLVKEQSDTERDVTRLRFGTALMLMISYAAGVGGLLTPIGTPPNLIGIGFIEEETDIKDHLLRLGPGRASDLSSHVRCPLRDPDPPQPPGGTQDLRRHRVRQRGAEQARPVLKG